MENSTGFLNRRLLGLTLPARLTLGLVIFLGFAGGLLVIAQAAVLSQVIGRVFLAGQVLSQVSPYLVGLVGLILMRSILVAAAEGLAGQCAIQIKTGLRERLFRHLFELGPAFLQSQTSGDLAARAMQGVENLESYFSQYLPQVVLAAVVPLSILVFVFPLDLLSGVILLVTAPLIPVFMYLIGASAEKLTRRQFAALSRMSAVFLDTLQGLAALKALNQADARLDKIRTASERYRAMTLQVLRITFLSALVLELVGTISTAIVAVEIGLRLLNSQLDFQQAFFILVIAPEFYLPLRQLGLRFHASASGVSAARAIFEVLDQRKPGCSTLMETSGTENIDSVQQIMNAVPCGLTAPAWQDKVEISFKDVSFTYPDRSLEAVNGVTFTIRPSEITALVGGSGTGKSTLVQLLLRFLSPQSGQILVNGSSLTAYDVRDWRIRVSWVPQQPYLFQDTLLANILLAKPEATLAEVRKAVRLAELEEFIQTLPSGYDTPIGEGGFKLSGGQAQRLALARAFLKNAPVLVLDEPTSHLDPELSERIQAAIQRLCQGRTVLVVAHRLQTIRQAGQIIVLENGRMVENGSHTNLLSRAGLYAQLYEQGGWER